MKAKIGRPTKYSQELLDKAEEYLTDFEYHGAVFPSHIGLSLYLGLNKDTLFDWAKQEDKKAFSDILRRILAVQHEMLIGNGITGKYNSNICKLVLGKHGYKDQGALTGADDKPLIPEYSDAEIVRRALFAMTKMLKAEED